MIDLVIVEPNEILRIGLRSMLEDDMNIQVLGEYESFRAFLPHVGDLNANIVVVSVNWPQVDDFELFKKMRITSPNTKVFALSGKQRDEELFAALMFGASGYLAIDIGKDELIHGVRVAAAGGHYFDIRVAKRILNHLMRMNHSHRTVKVEGLTERESQMLTLVALGYTNMEITQRLRLSASTVKNLVARLKEKLRVNSRVQLATFAMQNGFLETPSIE